MPSPEIVVAGHVCLDVIPTFPEQVHDHVFEPGSLLEVGPLVLAPGGVVSNVGLALHRLGVPVRLIGMVGDDLFGRAILQILRDHDPRLAGDMIVSAGDATSYTIVLSPPGVDRIFLHAPGANDTFRPGDVDVRTFPEARLLHFGYPSLMGQTYADEGEGLARLFTGVREHGACISLDMAQIDPSAKAARVDWAGFLERVLPQVDVFGPSIGEILDMLGRTGGTRGEGMSEAGRDAGRDPSDEGISGESEGFHADVENMPAESEDMSIAAASVVDGDLLIDVADHLLALGAGVVVLKLGSNGIFMRTTSDGERLAATPGLDLDGRWCGRTLLQPCCVVDVVGTTGAGDCTLAGLLAAMSKGYPPEACLRSAAAVGAFSVEQEDSTSGVPAWEAVQARLRHGWPLRDVALDLSGWSWSAERAVWAGPGDAG